MIQAAKKQKNQKNKSIAIIYFVDTVVSDSTKGFFHGFRIKGKNKRCKKRQM